ncbi:MAG: hypothetical protein EOP49_25965 [Sphingobacteriales bacterium]|nr:MAG: hypothetical protein EOP49_25965 [Sphingobacteriales bacterium]
MDQLKLDAWKQRFEEEVKALQSEYEALFLATPFAQSYGILLNVSDEWEVELADGLPEEIKGRFRKILIRTKPEDSV